MIVATTENIYSCLYRTPCIDAVSEENLNSAATVIYNVDDNNFSRLIVAIKTPTYICT